MPFRSKETLDAWVAEFRAEGHDVPGEVALQDGSEGDDTGLVLLRLTSAGTQTFMQPVGHGDPRWLVTFEPRYDTVSLTPIQVESMGRELQLIAALCSFLQAKSADHIEAHGL